MIKYDIYQLFPQYLLADKTGFAMAKGIEAGLNYFIAKCQEGIDTVQDIEKMPEWRLDELAWEYNCLYDYTADVEIKREWIRNAITYYSRHGTPEGIRQYLAAFFGESQIIEWFEDDMTPCYFDVLVTGTRSNEHEAWIRTAAERAKNVRSILRNIIYNGGETEAGLLAGAGLSGMMIVIEGTML